jgi:hypothetical protein
MQEPLSKDDWVAWLELPQTKAFFDAVKSEQQMLLQIAVKKVDMTPHEETRLIGVMSGLQKVLDFDYTDGTN